MRHVGAADIEDPGNGRRVGDEHCLEILLADIGGNGGDLVLGENTGLRHILDDDRPKRFRRPVSPELVERIMRQENQCAADLRQRLFELAHLSTRMQPRIDAELQPFLAMRRQPDMRRLVDEIAACEDGAIHLLGKLRHIAPVDIDDRFGPGDQRNARRAGEARQPGEPLRAGRHVLAVIFIGARHKESIDAERIETGAQCGNPFPAELRRGGDFERLEHAGNPNE